MAAASLSSLASHYNRVDCQYLGIRMIHSFAATMIYRKALAIPIGLTLTHCAIAALATLVDFIARPLIVFFFPDHFCVRLTCSTLIPIPLAFGLKFLKNYKVIDFAYELPEISLIYALFLFAINFRAKSGYAYIS